MTGLSDTKNCKKATPNHCSSPTTTFSRWVELPLRIGICKDPPSPAAGSLFVPCAVARRGGRAAPMSKAVAKFPTPATITGPRFVADPRALFVFAPTRPAVRSRVLSFLPASAGTVTPSPPGAPGGQMRDRVCGHTELPDQRRELPRGTPADAPPLKQPSALPAAIEGITAGFLAPRERDSACKASALCGRMKLLHQGGASRSRRTRQSEAMVIAVGAARLDLNAFCDGRA